EVLVSFLEGDPDQPLVAGCLYHAAHEPPYDLPANKTRSVFKTLSSPGGEGYNELRVEDRAGAEQLYIHAQRDWAQNIEHDQHIRVGHERHDTVEGASHSYFKADEHRTTNGERKVQVKGSDHLSVEHSQHVRLGEGQFIEAGQQIHLCSGQSLVIEAGMEITLKAGGSFIKLDPGGITLVGQIKANGGGAPGMGGGAAPLLPRQTQPADKDAAGALLLSPQRLALLQQGALCAVCEAAPARGKP
ncbi:bacteriophage T4 gp5 trimerisation domain-containing protein, partial [Pseudomonas typographi]|uniref:bacteriophage T4 gp5 trimerisation domain-containing protein n=1 Tax=Pseudomonas typographi TaxID=2715964 RepID=UPI003B84897B